MQKTTKLGSIHRTIDIWLEMTSGDLYSRLPFLPGGFHLVKLQKLLGVKITQTPSKLI